MLSSRLRKRPCRRMGRVVRVGWRQVTGMGGKEKVGQTTTKPDGSRSLGCVGVGEPPSKARVAVPKHRDRMKALRNRD